jgi:hypothetical protein
VAENIKVWRRSGLRYKKVDLARAHRQLLCVLDRDIKHLLVASHARQLTSQESTALINYLKLLPSLTKSPPSGKFPKKEDEHNPYDGDL